jgi:hypothetical protein
MTLSALKLYTAKFFSVLLISNALFILIYTLSSLIPTNTIVNQLKSAHETGVLKTPENSISRSTTGLGIDFGTECVALGLNLKQSPDQIGENKVLSRFYESYLPSTADQNQFDPCAGLLEMINIENDKELSQNLASYARNWWGVSIFIQIGVALFGLASLKSYLYSAMIILGVLFYLRFSKEMKNYLIGLLLLAPFILTGDFQDLYNVAPYSLFTIQMFLFGIILLRVMGKNENQLIRIFRISVMFGSVYNFMFWFNFHLILTFLPSVIYLTLLNKVSYRKIMEKITILLAGFTSGFIMTTFVKWMLGIVIYGGEIQDQIIKALGVRLSSNQNGLNAPLLSYTSGVDFLPIPFRAIVVNLMVYASKVIDPRSTSSITIGLMLSILLTIGLYQLKNSMFSFNTAKQYLFPAFPIFLIPFFYYGVTANHSFNHAALTYRALPLTLGFILSLLYFAHLSNESKIIRNYD